MARILRNLGIFVIIGSVVASMVNDMADLRLDFLIATLVRQGVFLGAAMLAGGLVLQFVFGLGGAVTGSRCRRCSKRVRKGQTYCADHHKQAVEEAVDMDRTTEGTYGRRPRS